MNHSDSEPRTRGIRVLLVEPDDSKARAIRDALDSSEMPFDVSVRRDARDGKLTYDVAVLSNSLPEMSGLEMHRRLRSENESPPVMLLFEAGEEADASAALLAGVDDVVVRDSAGGYLKLMPGAVAKLARGTSDTLPGSPYESAAPSLLESERLWRSMVESIRDVFYVLDLREKRALYVSPAYEEMFGLPTASIYENARAWMDAVHPEDRERAEADFAELLRSRGEGFRAQDYRIIKPDGAVRWLQNRVFVIRGARGEPLQIAGVNTDVTEAKEAERELRESEQRYRTLVDQASDGIFVADREGNHIDVNDAGCSMLGYRREEILALNIRDLIPDEDLANAPPRVEKLKNGALVAQERRLKCKDGSALPVEVSAKILPGGLVQAIVRDITERKRAEERFRKKHDELERRVEGRTRKLREAMEAFEQTQRLASIGTLAAGIAHEINNPLGSILMAADTAMHSLGDAAKKEDAEEALKSIKTDAKRAAQIVRTVLQLSRREESQKWPNDLADVARRARDITRRAADAAGVTVDLQIDPDMSRVVVNPTEIEQVFVNLINNAIDASSSGRSVRVRLAGGDQYVRAVFEDEGEGMTPEEVSRVFDPFYTTRHSAGGTGLGLSLSYSIVNQHRGEIEVDSQLGVGTRVTVILPKEEPPREDKGSA